MAFVKYTQSLKSAASTAHVRLSGASITVTQAGQDRFPQLAAAELLSLYYNPEGSQIGLAPSTQEDKDAFKFSRRGRGMSKVVSAARFFEQFGLRGDELTTDGMLQEEGDLLVFRMQPKGAGTAQRRTGSGRSKPGAHRGRKPRSASAEEPAGDSSSGDMSA